MKKHTTASTLNCGVAQALGVVGDTWSMLIMRDIFGGVTRFDGLQKSLGIASNILTARLQRLTAEGILERHEFNESPPRVEYAPTAKGDELYPVLLTLKRWGERWKLPAKRVPPFRYVHAACGHESVAKTVCEHCNTQLTAATVRREPARRRSA